MRVFLGLPNYDQRIHVDAMMSVIHAVDHGSGIEMIPWPLTGSLLPRVFNELLARAVMMQADLFAMQHADVVAEPGWLTKMGGLMHEHNADVLSAVIALKDQRQLTSTAYHSATERYRKLSVSEAYCGCPPVFDVNCDFLRDHHADVLLVNTGLMLMRLDRTWLKQWKGFEIRSRIVWGEDQITVDAVGEDWAMSEQLPRLGATVMATTAVRVHHWGSAMYDNVPPPGPQDVAGPSRKRSPPEVT